METFKDFINNVKPNWCPGCGDFSVQDSIQKSAANIVLDHEEVAIITCIGCSGRLSG
ncbi:2-oxoacid:ferredoxin oxidoreductase subunit beta, partial [Staphylococcus aureus]|nr:2-oxoacid:ferredoxin oxidoreductase subunit beta [Staphylococcus aureus]